MYKISSICKTLCIEIFELNLVKMKIILTGSEGLVGSELSKFFPYINSDGIETATFTDNQSEGWIDPFMFHSALKSKAAELGAEFIKGEVKSLSEIKAKTIVSAAGCWTKESGFAQFERSH